MQNNWASEMYREAQTAEMIGKDKDNPRDGKVLFRHYYIKHKEDEEVTGDALQVVDIEFDHVLKQEADKEATIQKAKRKFKNKSPDNVELIKTVIVNKDKTRNKHPAYKNAA